MNDYIESLIFKLRNTTFSCRQQEASSYEEGMQRLVDAFTEAKQKQTCVYFVGNGGSAAIAIHMTADFMKNGGMKTNSLYDSSVMTCMGNDYGYEHVFSRPLGRLICEGDLLVAISSSGRSPNILNAIKTAKEKKVTVITFTGFAPDNPARKSGDLSVYVPCDRYGIVESIHNLILQQVVDEILERDGTGE